MHAAEVVRTSNSIRLLLWLLYYGCVVTVVVCALCTLQHGCFLIPLYARCVISIVGSALRLATVFPARDLELLGSLAQAWAAAMAGRSAVNLIVTSVRTVPMAVGCDHSLD